MQIARGLQSPASAAALNAEILPQFAGGVVAQLVRDARGFISRRRIRQQTEGGLWSQWLRPFIQYPHVLVIGVEAVALLARDLLKDRDLLRASTAARAVGADTFRLLTVAGMDRIGCF
jgi:hypothetical protein